MCRDSGGMNRIADGFGGGGFIRAGFDLFLIKATFDCLGRCSHICVVGSGFDTFFIAVVGGGPTGCVSRSCNNRSASGFVGWCSVVALFRLERRGGTEVGWWRGRSEDAADIPLTISSGRVVVVLGRHKSSVYN